MTEPRLLNLAVRRYGEDESTPIVVDHRRACGTVSDHIRNGCIALDLSGYGRSGLVHLTTGEALRLSNLLRAMAWADGADGEVDRG